MILRHWSFLVAQFQAEPEAYAPLVCVEGDEAAQESGVGEWCIGFVRGINLDFDAGQVMLDYLADLGVGGGADMARVVARRRPVVAGARPC